ncbi:C13 family peptidase [Reyranella sp.]|uniref:C13 family peptidase n=1 Tax=Reyranella sp. TaxID=1929291 RepID=UPI003D1139C6
MFVRLAAAMILTLLVIGCTADDQGPPPATHAVSSAPGTGIPADRWRTVLVAGDNNSPAFDNGIDTLRERFAAMGVRDITSYSSARAGGQRLASSANVINALRTPGGQACLVYMTSHGDAQGFFLRPDHRLLSPAALDRALSEGCGAMPTVLIVSACHSGTFINAGTRRPNRIILAAAAADRTSFGCGADDDYTYYDQCFLQQLDGASTWAGLAQATRACVETLERRLGVRQQSRPQLFVGAAVANLRLPGR